jgi:predicted N-acetyltransferase YhbS
MSAQSTWTLRPLLPDDLNELMRLQARCFGTDFLESAEVYARRLASGHQQSFALACERTQTLQAYAAAYWSDPGKVTPFDGDFLAPSAADKVLYLHDVSVAPEWSGRGAANALVSALFQRARARGVQQAALVSVQGSQPYWKRHGFKVRALADARQQQHLRSYGDDASYMVASI